MLAALSRPVSHRFPTSGHKERGESTPKTGEEKTRTRTGGHEKAQLGGPGEIGPPPYTSPRAPPGVAATGSRRRVTRFPADAQGRGKQNESGRAGAGATPAKSTAKRAGRGRRRARTGPGAQDGSQARRKPAKRAAHGERSNYTKNSFCRAGRCPWGPAPLSGRRRLAATDTKRVFCTNCGRVVLFAPAAVEPAFVTAPHAGAGARPRRGRDGAGWVVRARMLGLFYIFCGGGVDIYVCLMYN